MGLELVKELLIELLMHGFLTLIGVANDVDLPLIIEFLKLEPPIQS